jgi:CRP/FNR family transcriptional regulator, cyclic AMP receptor protein
VETIKKLIAGAKEDVVREWISYMMQCMPAELRQKCQLVHRNKGKALMRVGDAAESVFLLIDGEVKIMNELPRGIIYVLGVLHAPGILGENEVLVNFPHYRGTVVCETECTFIYLSKADFLAWMKKSPEALYKVTVQIIEKNSSQVARDRIFLFSTGEKRLAYLLSRYYEGKAENGVCTLSIARRKLADEIGFCIKTIDRCIGKFKSLEMVSQQGMKIIITRAQYMMLREYNE